MLSFLKSERRDYLPVFDVTVMGKKIFLSYNEFILIMRRRYSWSREDDLES